MFQGAAVAGVCQCRGRGWWYPSGREGRHGSFCHPTWEKSSSLSWPLQPPSSASELSSTGALLVGHRHSLLPSLTEERQMHRTDLSRSHTVRPGVASCFCETPEHRYFRRCDPGRLRCDDSTQLCTAEAATDIEGQTHMAVFPIKLHLWTLKFPYHIIFTHHKIFVFFFPNHLKMLTIFSSWVTKNGWCGLDLVLGS